MKSNVCSLTGKSILALSVVFGGLLLTHVRADAATTDNSEEPLEQVNKKLTQNIGDKAMTQQSVEAAYNKLSENDKTILKNRMDKETATIVSGSTDSNSSYESKSAGSGFTVSVQTSDVEEGDNISPESKPVSRAFIGNVTKNYGDRQYIIDSGYNWKEYGLCDAKLSLHYTLNSSGMKMRYSSTAGTYHLLAAVTCSSKTTDAVATKVGANINAYGTYNCVFSAAGIVNMSTQYRIHGAVKINSWNKSAKSMNLHESWYEEK